MRRGLALGALVVALVVALAVWWLVQPGSGPSSTAAGAVAESDLPREARATLALVDAGGPFPYEEDGGTFENREGLLPPEPRGTYAEYTVETPGEDDRGPRRIVCIDTDPCWWTVDHYASFRPIDRGR